MIDDQYNLNGIIHMVTIEFFMYIGWNSTN